MNVAFIYAGNDLLSHSRVGRTLLSAAFDLGVVLDLVRIRIKSKTNVNGSGQECPLHTTETGQIECPFVTDSNQSARFE